MWIYAKCAGASAERIRTQTQTHAHSLNQTPILDPLGIVCVCVRVCGVARSEKQNYRSCRKCRNTFDALPFYILFIVLNLWHCFFATQHSHVCAVFPALYTVDTYNFSIRQCDVSIHITYAHYADGVRTKWISIYGFSCVRHLERTRYLVFGAKCQ